MADSINAPATRTSTAALFDYTYVSPEPLWDQIIDFKYILFRQGDSIGGKPYEEFFHIEVATDDASDTVKHITGTSACEFELSRRML